MPSNRLDSRKRSRVVALGLIVIGFSGAIAACSSPSDSKLAYFGPKIEGIRDIRLVDADGEQREKLFATTPGLKEGFFWFPDGERVIVFPEEKDEFYVAEIEGEIIGECLTCDIDEFGSPAISPDGRSIAWGARDGIYLQSTQDFSLTKVADLEKPSWLSWSPDSKSLTFAADDRFLLQIYNLSVGSGELQQLTQSVGQQSTESLAPAWSPKRGEIAFHMQDREGLHLMLMDSDGSDLRKLTDWIFLGEIYEYGFQRAPQWSPDGNQLLFSAGSELGDWDIFVINKDGSGLRNLTNWPGHDRDPAWSPDGKWIAFVTNRDGNREIYVMNADGSAPRNVSNRPVTPEMNPAWQP